MKLRTGKYYGLMALGWNSLVTPPLDIILFIAVNPTIMSQKAQIRECTVEELYAVPVQPPQQPAKVIPIIPPPASSQSNSSTLVASPAATTPPNISASALLVDSPVVEKTFLQKHAFVITITIVVAIGVGIYLYQRKKTKEDNQ